MVKYEIVEATEAHLEEAAANLRQADRDELWAAFHFTPSEALAAAKSEKTFASLADGKVLCIYGTWRPSATGLLGVPWMLSTNELPKHYRYFARESKNYVSHLKQRFLSLENYVDARNSLAIRWLRWLGFVMEKPRAWGADKLPFHRFHMEIV